MGQRVSEKLVERVPDDTALTLTLLDEAQVPRAPISPKVAPIMVASVVLGLIAALFAALAADRVKRAFDTGHAVRERLGTTVLGEIPSMRRRSERRYPTITLLDGRHPSVDMMAAFESVRANVELRMKETGADRIAIVSLQRRQGKSTVSAGLSYALATVGRKVVAIEADLRNPTLAEQLDVKPSQGIGDIAAYGRTEVSLQATSHPFLEFLSAGIPVGQAAHVVNSTLPGVLDAVAADGRMVIVDSPPFRGAPESAVVVAHAEYAILVVSSGSIDFDSMSEAIDRINEAGGTLLGVVINKVPRRRVQQDHYRTGAFSRRLGVSEVIESDDADADAADDARTTRRRLGRRDRQRTTLTRTRPHSSAGSAERDTTIS